MLVQAALFISSRVSPTNKESSKHSEEGRVEILALFFELGLLLNASNYPFFTASSCK